MAQIKTLPVFNLSDLSQEMLQQMEEEDTIKKIKKYIKNTKEKECKRYGLYVSEAVTICKQSSPINGIMLAFAYGRAKGYRAAQNEHKRKKA